MFPEEGIRGYLNIWIDVGIFWGSHDPAIKIKKNLRFDEGQYAQKTK